MSRRDGLGRLVASLAMVAGISLSAGAQTPDRTRTEEELTLEEARARALDSGPELRAAAAHLAAVEGALQQARALPNPDLSFEVEDFGGNLPVDVPSQQTLSIGQRVEWFGKRSARVEAARLESEVASFDLARRRRDVGHEVERRFAALLGAQERLAIADESTATAREVRAAVAALVSAGEVSPIEETRALGDEALAGIDRGGAARDVADAARALSQLWGDATASTPRAAGRLAQTALLLDRDAAFGGLVLLPDLARWDAETARLQALETLARREILPDLTLSAGARSFAGTGLRTWVAGVSLPVPLLTTYSGARSEATARLEQARQERRAEEARLRAACLTAQEALRQASSEVRILNESVLPNALLVYDALGEGYRRGKFRLLDLLEARRNLASVRLRVIDARTRLNLALADVRRLAPEELTAETRGTE
ncbi:MAG TPA: TolC family protein [Thermoanaerobaculia bacterium]|nr:TolC family protein [Thermoanaerobaculia bacterium]